MTFTLTGRGLTGLSEGSSGTAQSSPTRVPLLRLISVEGGAVTTLGSSHFSSTEVGSTMPHVPEGLYILSVTTQGIPGGGLLQVGPPGTGVEPEKPGPGPESRSYYGWGCSASPAPGAAWAWAVSVLGWGLARRRKRGLAIAACVLLVLVGGQAFAKTDIPETRNPFIPAIARAYESLELEAALSALRKASAWPDNGLRERLWLALMEGVLQFGAGDEARALAAFGRALAMNPGAQLPVQASPKLRDHFARAREVLGPPAPKAPPPEPSPSPSPVPVPLEVPVSVPASPPVRPEPPTPKPPAPAPVRQPLEWGVGLRGEAEVLGRAVVPALTGELSLGHLGAAATVVLQPSPGLRLEGRITCSSSGCGPTWPWALPPSCPPWGRAPPSACRCGSALRSPSPPKPPTSASSTLLSPGRPTPSCSRSVPAGAFPARTGGRPRHLSCPSPCPPSRG